MWENFVRKVKFEFPINRLKGVLLSEGIGDSISPNNLYITSFNAYCMVNFGTRLKQGKLKEIYNVLIQVQEELDKINKKCSRYVKSGDVRYKDAQLVKMPDNKMEHLGRRKKDVTNMFEKDIKNIIDEFCDWKDLKLDIITKHDKMMKKHRGNK